MEQACRLDPALILLPSLTPPPCHSEIQIDMIPPWAARPQYLQLRVPSMCPGALTGSMTRVNGPRGFFRFAGSAALAG
jgi:hypothetical protein